MVGRFKLCVYLSCDYCGFKGCTLSICFPELIPHLPDFRHAFRRFVQVDAFGQLLYAVPDNIHCITVGEYLPAALDFVVLCCDTDELGVASFSSRHTTPAPEEIPARRRATMVRTVAIPRHSKIAAMKISATSRARRLLMPALTTCFAYWTSINEFCAFLGHIILSPAIS